MKNYIYIIGFCLTLLVSCKEEITNNEPLYKDATQEVAVRVSDLMSKMTLEEKVAQMCQYVGVEHIKKAEKRLSKADLDKNDAQGYYPGMSSKDVEELTIKGKIGSFLHVKTIKEANDLQKLAQQSRLKIPLLIGIDAIHGNGLFYGATIYPSPIAQAATWDDALMYKASKQTALEMRATGTHWAFTPNIDVLRDPRWGRTGETFGEDPYLVGNMGIATINGLQSNDFTGFSNVIACAKHLVAGSQSINGLNAAPTDVSYRTLLEIFLPPYKRAVKETELFSIMTAHNEVNGVPAHIDSHMMTDLLRERWGFKGFYVSDWNDVSRVATWHFVANDFKEASKLAVNAGLDMHMHGPFFLDYVLELVEEGKIDEDRIDEACSKILESKFRLGLFENPFVNEEKSKLVVLKEAHQETALNQARKSITLLKNDGVLPLQKISKKSIFVVGPNANNQTTLGDWVVPQPDENITTIYEGIQNVGTNYGYSVSTLEIGYNSKEIKDTAILKAGELASKADVTVLVLGENSYRHDAKNKTTGENVDRATLKLSGKQLQLANKVLENGKPVILIYVSGSPIAEPELEAKVNAVLNTWEPGAFGGKATAEILFGEVNPSGKLPVTIPRNVGQLQMVYNHKPTAYVHRYHTMEKTPLHPFGFGLSYTNFGISTPQASKTIVKENETISVTVTVKNLGLYNGEEVVQLYIRDKVSSVTRPVKELKKYKRVFLEKGTSKQIEFQLSPTDLAFYNREMKYGVEAGEFSILVGNSSATKDLKETTIKVDKYITITD